MSAGAAPLLSDARLAELLDPAGHLGQAAEFPAGSLRLTRNAPGGTAAGADAVPPQNADLNGASRG